MLSSDRRGALALIAAGMVSACGYSPVYAPGAQAHALRNAVLVDAPTNKDAFDLTRRIEERLGRATAPRFGLNVVLDTAASSLAIDDDNDVTRYTLAGQADYALRDLDTGRVVLSGRVDTFSAYSATGSTVTTRAAEIDGRRRLMVMLADLIVTDLLAGADGLSR